MDAPIHVYIYNVVRGRCLDESEKKEEKNSLEYVSCCVSKKICYIENVFFFVYNIRSILRRYIFLLRKMYNKIY